MSDWTDATESFSTNSFEATPRGLTAVTPCRVYWGSHGCDLERGHVAPHDCMCCECPLDTKNHLKEQGCVSTAPYYGWRTLFYGEDAPRQRALRLFTDIETLVTGTWRRRAYHRRERRGFSGGAR